MQKPCEEWRRQCPAKCYEVLVGWGNIWCCNVKELWGGAIHCFVKVVSSLIMQCKGEVKFALLCIGGVGLSLALKSKAEFGIGSARLSSVEHR